MKTKTLVTTLTATLLMSGVALSASAADPVRGKMLYFNTNGATLSCGSSGCHAPDPTSNPSNVKNGSTGAAILKAIDSVAVMTAFVGGKVTAVDADDIAAYIVNPAAGTPSPAATLTTASLAFANQVLQTTSGTMSASLRNSGSADLVLSTVTLAGANPGDFTRAGTCVPNLKLTPTQSCSIDVTFKPTALGARAAAITVGHNASPATSTLNLTGSGVSAPTPAVALSAMSLAFGNQTIGMVSSPRTVSISNTGTANLVLGTITTAGANAADFASSKCSGTSLAPGASCTVDVTFTPAALTVRSATLSIPTNASGSPHGVALSGTGVAAPVAAVTLSPTTLAFGNQTTGATSAKSIGLTNSGNAGLQITSIATSSSGFALKHNCPATLAASANCSIDVTFAPTSATAYSGTVSIVSAAAGSPHSVGLSGTGTAPVVLAPQVTLSPLAIDFGTLPLNTPSSQHAVSLKNSGNGPLSLTAVGLAGANATDFAQQTNTCPVGGSLAAGLSCTITLKFTPTVAGARLASLTVSSNAPGAPAVELKGTGVVQAAALAQVAPMQAAFGRVRIGKTSDERKVRIRNTGTTLLVLGNITATGDYLVERECKSTLPAGEACEVKVRFKPTALGLRQGELTVASNAAGSPHAVKLSGTGTNQRTQDDDECDDDSSCGQAMLPFGRRRH